MELKMQASLDVAAMWAQVLIAGMTTLGVLTSMVLSIAALREVREDRQLRHAPFLVFDSGGWDLPVSFVKAGSAVPGMAPKVAARYFGSLGSDAESVRLRKARYGRLLNLGSGPAIEVDGVL